jgi:transcription-repair coupling factor (superfamily II helicase)
MHGILKPLEASAEFVSLAAGLKEKQKQMVFGLSGPQRAYLLAGLVEQAPNRSFLVLTAGEREAADLGDAIACFSPGSAILQFPVMHLLPYQILAQSTEVAAQRLRVLEILLRREPGVIIAPVEAMLRCLTPPEQFKAAVLRLAVGDQIDLEKLVYDLSGMGYERVELIEGRGQFARRGGILDIFPMTAHRPYRLEFFDDEVDTIRRFNIASQRSEEKVSELVLFPASELIADAANRAKARQRFEKEYLTQCRKLEETGEPGALQQLREKYGAILDSFDGYFNGIEQFMPYFYPETVTLLDYLPEQTPVYLDDPLRLKEVVELSQRERAGTYSELLVKGKLLPGQLRTYTDWEHLSAGLGSRPAICSSLLPRRPGFIAIQQSFNLPGKPVPSFLGKLELLAEELRHWRSAGYAVVLYVSGQQRAQQMLHSFREHNIDAFYANSLKGHVRPGNVVLANGHIESGFGLPFCRLVVLTEGDIIGRRKKASREVKRADKLAPFVDLKTGDYVVHVHHGIGRYLGVTPLNIQGIKKEYLLIKFAGEDKLYVPVDQVGLIQKYLGGEGEAPRLSRLGGAEWAKAKSKVKAAVREMAQDLLKLYAARETIKGYAFSKDTVWQSEFEEAFPFEETPDQLRAVNEIKADMESPRPMDRLLCGDVGYGKTEVALRAAFKAVMDGKQVALLAPTTILAQQHYNTFLERFKGFPVNIDVLSRFRSPREQRQVLRELGKGMVDIVIGTHRLLQDDVKFKDLGLMIVDEEQRFGVAHKEKLKLISKNVDVVTLSATPIPRTLQMSLVGMRDTSILETPPENRYPVQTYVLEEDPVLIREAIRREMGRGGQVFYVYNRIYDMDRVANWLLDLVPEARIAVAHGQIKEDVLERIMLDFMNHKYDVLLCTTIIENGLDIPNVNTLIVKDSGMMGLAQLYQLRGRVGRSNRVAYAYFTYRKDKSLGEAAEKRLAAIREFTELGSGFKIAMRDLEIRGAGNILGVEQHGHIAAVGFDLYSRLLEEAVREAKGVEAPVPAETSIELPVEAYIPDAYIPDTNQKVAIYKRIASFDSLEEIPDMEDELVDRYGDLPAPVNNLLAVARIRVLAGKLKIKSISLVSNQLRLLLHPGQTLAGEDLVAAGSHYPNRVKYSVAGEEFEIKLRLAGKGQVETSYLLEQVEAFLNILGGSRHKAPLPGESPVVVNESSINI